MNYTSVKIQEGTLETGHIYEKQKPSDRPQLIPLTLCGKLVRERGTSYPVTCTKCLTEYLMRVRAAIAHPSPSPSAAGTLL